VIVGRRTFIAAYVMLMVLARFLQTVDRTLGKMAALSLGRRSASVCDVNLLPYLKPGDYFAAAIDFFSRLKLQIRLCL